MTDLTDLSMREAGILLLRREASACDLLEATLAQLEESEPSVHAYATVTEDVARAAARAAQKELDRGRWRGPMHGIPVGVKDLFYTKDAPTEAGSKVLAGFVPDDDADAVRRLRTAGAVMVGKTVTHEFAYGQNVPPTRNALDNSCYPGGSSAGSAVAVAARSAYGALGTDSGGSVRVPASLNGVVGIKPTFGRISRRGVVAMSPSLDHVGPIARTVEDCALMLGELAGFDPLDSSSLDTPVDDYTRDIGAGIAGMRIGVEREFYFGDHVVPEVRDALVSAMSVLQDLGATIVEVSIPRLGLMPTVGLITLLADTSDYHRALLRDRAAAYEPKTRVMLEVGSLVFARSYLAAQRARTVLRHAMKDAFLSDRLDAMVAPTQPVMTKPVEQLPVDLVDASSEIGLPDFVRHTWPANLTGQPALTLPCGLAPSGLPVGMELLGRPLDEATLFRIGHAYEQETES
ncbi:MAG: Amidase [Solirubrobacterales bacterium]|nr:Amidase [Solirubrobacterales bacterium]